MTLISAFDPGFTGALTLYNPGIKVLEIHDMPVFKLRGRLQVDRYKVAQILRSAGAPITLAVVEAVGPGEDQGVASMFRFGRGVGHVEGVLAGLGIPVLPAEPGAWKAGFGLVGGTKADSRRKAQVIFREHELKFRRVKDHGRAEAALLAVYGARFLATVGGQ